MTTPPAEVRRAAEELLQPLLSSGEIGPDTSEDLDRSFEEIAPPGARVSGSLGMVETLIHWRFDPEIPTAATRARFGRTVRLVKRFLKPLTTWQLRHLTDQLNAYAAMQAEVLKELMEGREDRT